MASPPLNVQCRLRRPRSTSTHSFLPLHPAFSPPAARRGSSVESRWRNPCMCAASDQANAGASCQDRDTSGGTAARARRTPSLREAIRDGDPTMTDQQPHAESWTEIRNRGRVMNRCSRMQTCIPTSSPTRRITSSLYSSVTTRAAGRDGSQAEKRVTKADLNPVEVTSALCDKLHANTLNFNPPAISRPIGFRHRAHGAGEACVAISA